MPIVAQTVLIRLATPATVFLAILLVRKMLKCMRTCSCCVETTKAELIVTSLVVLFFFYPKLLHTGLTMFACIPIDDAHLASDPYPQFASANASRGYFVWDVQQACWEGWHLSWVLGLGLPCMLCFCILVPVGMYFMLQRNRASPEGTPSDNYTCCLYHCFTPDRYYWEVVASAQTIVLVAVSTFSFSLGAFHAALLMLVCFACILAMQHIFQPYAFQEVQHMQLMSSTCLVLTATIGLSIFEVGGVAVPRGYTETVGVLGLLANLAFVCWCSWRTAKLGSGMLSDWVVSAWAWLSKKRRTTPPQRRCVRA